MGMIRQLKRTPASPIHPRDTTTRLRGMPTHGVGGACSWAGVIQPRGKCSGDGRLTARGGRSTDSIRRRKAYVQKSLDAEVCAPSFTSTHQAEAEGLKPSAVASSSAGRSRPFPHSPGRA
jgi:hypothetical protein